MTPAHWLLALAAVALPGVIAAQDWLYIPLRNETVSSGLTGPYHVWLDASYVPLAAGLVFVFRGNPWTAVPADVAAVSLLLVAATNTGWRWFDAFTDGGHAKLHSFFTLVVFISAIVLQWVGDIRVHSVWRAWMTVANIAIPSAVYCVFHFNRITVKGVTISASPAAEKIYVLGLCFWLMVW